MGEFIQVFTTTGSPEEAQQIAETLVREGLAGCVQVLGPIRSMYRWQGAVETAEEWLCLIKSRSDLYPQLEAAIKALHSYEVPEIIAVAVTHGYEPYLTWLSDSLREA